MNLPTPQTVHVPGGEVDHESRLCPGRHGEHVVRVSPSLADLPAAVRGLQADDAAARRIARRGAAQIELLLTERHLVGYVRQLLERYATHLVADAAAPSAQRLYHSLCRARQRFFCTHSRPGRPPQFDSRS